MKLLHKLKLFTAVLFLILLQSCINYEQEVKLFTDGSGKMKIDYWMNLPDKESIHVVDKLGIFNADSIKSEFDSEHCKVENVQVYKDTIDGTTHAIINLSFSHIDSLNKTKAFADADFSFKPGPAGLIIYSQNIPPIATGFGIDGSDYRVTYRYIISGDIITHNATESKGRTLTWSYSLSDIGGGKEISVTFKPFKLKETPTWIYLISGLVLIVVIFFLFSKKRR